MKRLIYITVLAMIGLFSSINVEAQTWEWKGETVKDGDFYIMHSTEKFLANASANVKDISDVTSNDVFNLTYGEYTVRVIIRDVKTVGYAIKNKNGRYIYMANLGSFSVNSNTAIGLNVEGTDGKDSYNIHYSSDKYLNLNGTKIEQSEDNSAKQYSWRLISQDQMDAYKNNFPALKTKLSSEKLSGSAIKTAIEGSTYNWKNLSDGENLVNAYIALYDRITGMGELVADGAIAKLKTLSTKDEIDAFDGELTAFVNAKQAVVDELNAMTDISEEMAEARDQAVAGVNAVPFDASKTLEENKVNLEAARKPVTDVLARNNMLSLDGFYIYPGETKTISVTLANTLPVQSLSFEMLLPEGLTVSNFQKTDREPENYSINETTNTTTDAHFILNVTTDSDEAIEAGEGAIITFDVTATEDFAYENAQIVISDIKAANAQYTGMVKTDNADGIYTNTATAVTLKAAQDDAVAALTKDLNSYEGYADKDMVVAAYYAAVAAVEAAKSETEVEAAQQNGVAAIQTAVDDYKYINEGFIPGHVNGNETVDILDYVVLAKKILTNDLPSNDENATRDDKRLFNILNANKDEVINVADLAEIINMILRQANPNYQPAVTSQAKGALRNAGTVTTTLRGNDLLIGLNNNINVVAMQMDITVPGATVTAQQLFADRADAHTIMLGDFGNGTYRILVVGTQNKPFIGNDGNIVALSLSGLEGEVEISNIYASDAAAVSYTLDKGGVATAIESAPSSADSSAIHNISGMRLSEPAKGIYIQNGKKFVK